MAYLSASPFSSNGVIVSSVAAVSRCAEKLSRRLLVTPAVTVNLPYRPDGAKLGPADLRRSLSNQRGMSFLIGSLRLLR
ncbi:MAG: hypothetical protein ACR2F9_06205 [Longimicrobiaceae bacterium]